MSENGEAGKTEKTGNIKLVIFDLDGVLIDSRDLWYLAWKDAFKSAGKCLSYDEFIKDCWGMPFPQTSREKGITGDRFEKASEVIVKSFISRVDRVKVFDGVFDVMAALDKIGIKKALLTNNMKPVIDTIMNKFNMKFDTIPQLEKLKNKPDPAGIYVVLEELGVKKEEAIFVGDTWVDNETGKNAGIRTILVGRDIKNVSEVLEQI